jgi:hypothetical protein
MQIICTLEDSADLQTTMREICKRSDIKLVQVCAAPHAELGTASNKPMPKLPKLIVVRAAVLRYFSECTEEPTFPNVVTVAYNFIVRQLSA